MQAKQYKHYHTRVIHYIQIEIMSIASLTLNHLEKKITFK